MNPISDNIRGGVRRLLCWFIFTVILTAASFAFAENLPPALTSSDLQKVMNWIAQEVSVNRQTFCWRGSYGRGAGSPMHCPEGKAYDAGLCYTPCKDGYKGVGPVCWQSCMPGFRDDGAFCAKPKPYGRGAGYPWKIKDKLGSLNQARDRCARDNPQGCEKYGQIIYPKCREGFHPAGCCICSPNCKGMKDIGVSCQKDTYGRGVGKPVTTCGSNEDKQGLLCYPKCKTGHKGVGPVCWETCRPGQTECGMGCASGTGSCVKNIASKTISPLALAWNIATLGSTSAATSAFANILKGTAEVAKTANRVFTPSWELSKTIDLWANEYCNEFEAMTNKKVVGELSKRFSGDALLWVKQQYAKNQLALMLKHQKIETADRILTAVGALDPSGVTGVIAAFNDPKCAEQDFPTVRLTGTYNLALAKKAGQSSVAYGGDPQRAVDGNASGNYSANSVTHTNNGPNEWWQVDLGEVRELNSIRIWNRTDCCGDRLKKFYVFVSKEPFTSSNLQDTFSNRNIKNNYHEFLPGMVPQPIHSNFFHDYGRYVRIQLAGADYLSLAEVEVIAQISGSPEFGTQAESFGWMPGAKVDLTKHAFIGGQESGKWLPLCRAAYLNGTYPGRVVDGKCSFGLGGKEIMLGQFEVLTGMNNVAVGKRTNQSSTFSGGDPERAVDGNTDGNYNTYSVTHTNNKPRQFWQINLDGLYEIGNIRIWNRTDCCAERLKDFYVFVSPSMWPMVPTIGASTPDFPKGVWNKYIQTVAGRPMEISVNTVGQHIRIQHARADYLSLAEVQVMAPANLPVPINTFTWVPSTGIIPANAFIGGEDSAKQPLPICRAAYQSNTYSGKVVGGKCSIGLGGSEIMLASFDVLVKKMLK